MAKLVQIFEFGQTPIQLFKEPHPAKNSRIINSSMLDKQKQEIDLINELTEKKYQAKNAFIQLERDKEREKSDILNNFNQIDEKDKDKIKKLKESYFNLAL